MIAHYQLIHGTFLGDHVPTKEDINKVKNEFKLPSALQFQSGKTALVCLYEICIKELKN